MENALKRYALIVGTDKYKDPAINDLRCAENDCIKLCGLLEHAARYDKVKLLRGAGSTEVLDIASDMAGSLNSGDLFLFYFAGHGVTHEGRHLLLCPKAKHKRLKYFQQTVPVDLLKDETEKSGLHRVFILDACRNSLLCERGSEASGLENERGLRDIVAKSSAADDSGSLALLCSCSEKQTAGEIAQLGQGLFTAALVDVLKESLDGGTEVAFSDVLEGNLSEKMSQYARKYGLPVGQRPWIQRSGSAPVIISGANIGEFPSLHKKPSVQPEETRIGTIKVLEEPKLEIVTKPAGCLISYQLSPADEKNKLELATRIFDRYTELATEIVWKIGRRQIPVGKNNFRQLFKHPIVQESIRAGQFCDISRLIGIKARWNEGQDEFETGISYPPTLKLPVYNTAFLRAADVATQHQDIVEEEAVELEQLAPPSGDREHIKALKLVHYKCAAARLWALLGDTERSKKWLQHATDYDLDEGRSEGARAAWYWHEFLCDTERALEICDIVESNRKKSQERIYITISLAETLWGLTGNKERVHSLLGEAESYISKANNWSDLESLAVREACLLGNTDKAKKLLEQSYKDMLREETYLFFTELAEQSYFLSCPSLVSKCLIRSEHLIQQDVSPTVSYPSHVQTAYLVGEPESKIRPIIKEQERLIKAEGY